MNNKEDKKEVLLEVKNLKKYYNISPFACKPLHGGAIMKKKLVCALVVLAAFTIAACDNGGNKSQTQDSQQTKAVAPMDEAKQSMKDAGAFM